MLAVDLVLLPPQKIMEMAVSRNKDLNVQVGQKMILNTTDCLPHISLLMGTIEEKDMVKIQGILEELIQDFLPLPMEIRGIKSSTLSGLSVTLSKQLKALHEIAVQKLKPYFSHLATPDTFFEEVDQKDIEWVNNFTTNASGDKYWPHITIGAASQNEVFDKALQFSCSKMAICHLGKYCTCREVLFSKTNL